MSSLYASRMRPQGHNYWIRDDPERWAHFKRYLDLLPKHAPLARIDYVQPSYLWEVQTGKARGPDLRRPEADVNIDISRYRHVTEADQVTLCAVMRVPQYAARWAGVVGSPCSSGTQTSPSRKQTFGA